MNQIHPTAVIEGDVQLGENNVIGPYCVLNGPLTIGDDNWIGPHVCIGTPGQDTRNPRYDSSQARIAIGSRNIIREFTAIQKPCYRDITQLGDDIYLMQSVHIPHDAILEDKVVITPMAVLAGVSRIMEGANIGMGATVHQYGIVGPYSIVATGAAAIKNVRPWSRFIPGKPASVNTYAIEKFGFSAFSAEIEAWVLRDVAPSSPPVVAVVERYLALHQASGRAEYR